MKNFSDICQEVYFTPDYSHFDFITVNAGLQSLLVDYSRQVTPERKVECLDYAQHCRQNLETALSSLSLHLPATQDAIIALLFGVSFFLLVLRSCLYEIDLLSRPPIILNSQSPRSVGHFAQRPRSYAKLWGTIEHVP